MDYVGIVLVSHSEKVVKGIKEIIRQVIHDVPVGIAGGTDDGGIGTSIEKISAAMQLADRKKGVLLFYDLGSAKMNAEVAIEIGDKKDVYIMESPLLEGAYVAAVESSTGKSVDDIIASLQESFS